MNKSIWYFLSAAVLLLCGNTALSQDRQACCDSVLQLPEKGFAVITAKTNAVREKMDRQTVGYLLRLQKKEDLLRKKLAGQDSTAATDLFAGSQQKYNELIARLKKGVGIPAGINGNVYGSQLDSLKTAFKFLGQSSLLSSSSGELKKLEGARKSINDAQASLNQTAKIDQFLQERQQLLQGKMLQYGLVKDFNNFKKEAYYYQQQAASYKTLLDDPEALGAKSLSVIKQLPLFKQFFSDHSELAGLFVLPGATTPDVGANAIVGLQTRSSVQGEMQGKFGKTVNVQQVVQKNVQQANESGIDRHFGAPGLPIGSIHLPSIGGSNGPELTMPDFKPNTEHTKTFWKRLEWGFNLQTVKSNGYWPATSDIGLSIGYRLSEKNIVGIGGSYKMGLGKDWQHMALSTQGAGLRAFLDSRIKGSIWLTAGAELNYQQAVDGHLPIPGFDAWRKSALAGLTKKYKIGRKMKGNVQLLYDFLHASHLPPTPALLFRIGYSF